MNKLLYVTVQNSHYQAKYNSQIEAWRKLGYEAEYFNLDRTLCSIREFFSIVKCFDVIYLRNDYLLYTMWLFIVFALSGKKIILEIPTPINVFWHELRLSHLPSWKKLILPKMIKLYLKLIIKRVDLIIEMAEEQEPIVLAQQNKFFIWQNGMNSVDAYKLPKNYIQEQNKAITKFFMNNEIRLILVANLAEYHGLDRIIEGLYLYYSKAHVYKVYVDVISSFNDTLIKNKKLVENYELSEYVNFIGNVEISKLAEFYKQANSAIGSISFNKIFLDSGSPLKLREYAMFGLPSCINYHDYDLSNTDFVFTCSRSEEPIDVNVLIEFYKQLLEKHGVDLTKVIQDYALNNLMWQHKVEKLRDECVARKIIVDCKKSN